MKAFLTLSFVLVACFSSGFAADLADKEAKPVKSYRDVLAVIPREMDPHNARHWTKAEKDVANLIIKKKLIATNRRVALRIRAEAVEAWPGLTLWANLPADEGYPIRMFLGKFKNPDSVGKLAAFREGDSVLVEGVLDYVAFEDLWGGGSLSICLRDGVVTKLQPDGKPMPPQPKASLSVVSAVYGSGDKFSDVTDRVKQILDEPGAHFTARPHWLGADPTVGWNKALVIVYQVQGKRLIFSTGEGGEVSAETLMKNP